MVHRQCVQVRPAAPAVSYGEGQKSRGEPAEGGAAGLLLLQQAPELSQALCSLQLRPFFPPHFSMFTDCISRRVTPAGISSGKYIRTFHRITNVKKKKIERMLEVLIRVQLEFESLL